MSIFVLKRELNSFRYYFFRLYCFFVISTKAFPSFYKWVYLILFFFYLSKVSCFWYCWSVKIVRKKGYKAFFVLLFTVSSWMSFFYTTEQSIVSCCENICVWKQKRMFNKYCLDICQSFLFVRNLFSYKIEMI